MKTKLLFAILTLMIHSALSQVLDSSSYYFPLKIGNKWLYDVTSGYHQYYYTNEVIGDTITPNGKIYFLFERNELLGLNNYIMHYVALVRLDTATSIIYVLNAQDSLEIGLDSLSSSQGDRFGNSVCWSIRIDTVLGFPTVVKNFSRDVSYAFGFGIVEGSYWDLNWPFYYHLIYAKINGVEYGTPLSIRSKEVITPQSIVLSQNFPNPFNPVTTITFSLDQTEYVNLAVYNILGKELQSIVSGVKEAGVHTINFSADKFSSGVYYYVLRTRHHTLSKSMMLVK